MRPMRRIMLFVGLSLCVLALSGCGGTSTDSAPTTTTPEENLAIIQIGHKPDSDDSTLLRITYLLDRMEEECPANTRTQLSDLTAGSQIELKKAGVKATPIESHHVRQSSSLRQADDCSDLFVAYVLLKSDTG